MPIIKSAKKKLRQDKKRKLHNLVYKEGYKKALKTVKGAVSATGKKTEENLRKAFSAIDKAQKKRVIHKNKAARLKSQISKKKKK